MHNYYLHEEDGRLSMIPWDYNLAFGGFDRGGGGRPAVRPEGAETAAMAFGGGAPRGTGNGAVNRTDGRPGGPAVSGNEWTNRGGGNMAGGSGTSATAWVNFPIDTPVFGAAIENRPLLRELLADEGCLEKYHQLFSWFIRSYFDSGSFVKSLDRTVALISPFVETDPTAFCTHSDFLAAQGVLREFCLLRAESVKGQLKGTIGRTSEGQQASGNRGFIDAANADGGPLDFNRMGNSFVSYNSIR
jgi:spore coat protein CotH